MYLCCKIYFEHNAFSFLKCHELSLNISSEDHIGDVDLYDTLPRVTDKNRARRLRLAVHCRWHSELVASGLILGEPNHGARSRGRPTTIYVDTLERDTVLSSTSDIRTLNGRSGIPHLVLVDPLVLHVSYVPDNDCKQVLASPICI